MLLVTESTDNLGGCYPPPSPGGTRLLKASSTLTRAIPWQARYSNVRCFYSVLNFPNWGTCFDSPAGFNFKYARTSQEQIDRL